MLNDFSGSIPAALSPFILFSVPVHAPWASSLEQYNAIWPAKFRFNSCGLLALYGPIYPFVRRKFDKPAPEKCQVFVNFASEDYQRMELFFKPSRSHELTLVIPAPEPT